MHTATTTDDRARIAGLLAQNHLSVVNLREKLGRMGLPSALAAQRRDAELAVTIENDAGVRVSVATVDLQTHSIDVVDQKTLELGLPELRPRRVKSLLCAVAKGLGAPAPARGRPLAHLAVMACLGLSVALFAL